MKKNLCQGSTSFFHGPVFVASMCPKCDQTSTILPFKSQDPELQQKYSAPNTNKGNKKNQAKPLIVRGFRLFGLPSNESCCQVMKTTRNCIEVDVFSRHLKQINTRKIRTYPNKKEWTKNAHVWNHHKKHWE